MGKLRMFALDFVLKNGLVAAAFSGFLLTCCLDPTPGLPKLFTCYETCFAEVYCYYFLPDLMHCHPYRTKLFQNRIEWNGDKSHLRPKLYKCTVQYTASEIQF
jgi:hypothetical protein